MKRPLLLVISFGILLVVSVGHMLKIDASDYSWRCFENKKKKTDLIVIVPGSKSKTLPLLEKVSRKFYEHYGVDVSENEWPETVKDYFLKNTESAVCIFNWPGGITRTFSLTPAGEKLSEYLEKESGYEDIRIFGKSLGGIIGEIALQEVSNPSKIRQLIYVATPHKSEQVDIPDHIEVINIYSLDDQFLRLGNNLLYFGKGVNDLENAENIEMKNLKHSDFNRNIKVYFNDSEKQIFEVYLEYLKN